AGGAEFDPVRGAGADAARRPHRSADRGGGGGLARRGDRGQAAGGVGPGGGALAAHERMTEIKLRLLGDRVSRRTAWQIAREHDWDTLRDAEYLAVTRLQADALVTVDPALAALARDVGPLATVDGPLAP